MAAKLDEEELSRASGRTPFESIQVAGWSGDLLPELATFKGLARSIGDAQKEYRDAGDSTSADNLLQMEQTLASRLTTGEGGRMVISQLVGHAIEALTLKQLDQNASYDFLGGKTPTERLAELKQERASIKEMSRTLSAAYGKMTEAEMLGFSDRWKTYGELKPCTGYSGVLEQTLRRRSLTFRRAQRPVRPPHDSRHHGLLPSAGCR
jgi:hypothetical protein